MIGYAECTGAESNLNECTIARAGNCHDGSDAGVKCLGELNLSEFMK